MSRQLIRRRRGGDQLDAGAIREFEVVVTDAVRVKAARLDDETQAPLGLGSLLQVLHDERNVVDSNEGQRRRRPLFCRTRERGGAGVEGCQRKQSRGDELPPVQAPLPVT
jgi:hypothetical protein